MTFDLRCAASSCSVIAGSDELGSRECSVSVLKMEVGALPQMSSMHSVLSSHSTPGHTMPSAE